MVTKVYRMTEEFPTKREGEGGKEGAVDGLTWGCGSLPKQSQGKDKSGIGEGSALNDPDKTPHTHMCTLYAHPTTAHAASHTPNLIHHTTRSPYTPHDTCITPHRHTTLQELPALTSLWL